MTTAVRALAKARTENDPDDVAWLSENAEMLADRLARGQRPISPGTVATYVSRARAATRLFGESPQQKALPGMESPAPTEPRSDVPESPAPWAGRDRLRQTLARVPAPPTPVDELAEAVSVVSRWPSLLAELVPALARAVERIERSGPEKGRRK